MENRGSSKDNGLMDRAYTMFKYFITTVMLVMVVVIFVNACMRYIFNQGFAASEEIARFAFVWISFLGMIIAYFQNKHVSVDFLAVLFKGRGRLVFDLISDSIIFIALSSMLYGSILYYQDTWLLKSPATGIPYGFIYVAAILAAILMIFKLFSLVKKQISEYKQYELERGEK